MTCLDLSSGCFLGCDWVICGKLWVIVGICSVLLLTIVNTWHIYCLRQNASDDRNSPRLTQYIEPLIQRRFLLCPIIRLSQTFSNLIETPHCNSYGCNDRLWLCAVLTVAHEHNKSLLLLSCAERPATSRKEGKTSASFRPPGNPATHSEEKKAPLENQ